MPMDAHSGVRSSLLHKAIARTKQEQERGRGPSSVSGTDMSIGLVGDPNFVGGQGYFLIPRPRMGQSISAQPSQTPYKYSWGNTVASEYPATDTNRSPTIGWIRGLVSSIVACSAESFTLHLPRCWQCGLHSHRLPVGVADNASRRGTANHGGQDREGIFMLHAVVLAIVNITEDSTPCLNLRHPRGVRGDAICPRPPPRLKMFAGRPTPRLRMSLPVSWPIISVILRRFTSGSPT